jgi:hypothetical protein
VALYGNRLAITAGFAVLGIRSLAMMREPAADQFAYLACAAVDAWIWYWNILAGCGKYLPIINTPSFD